jgi:hypothetical protein
VPAFTPTADPEVHITDVWLDDEYDDSDALDFSMAPEGTREALELIKPLLDDEASGQTQLAHSLNVPTSRVQHAVQLVRAEARRQRLSPPSAAEDERHAHADRARDLREQGHTYPQIATELGLRDYHAVRALLADYHPDLLRVRAKATGGR